MTNALCIDPYYVSLGLELLAVLGVPVVVGGIGVMLGWLKF